MVVAASRVKESENSLKSKISSAIVMFASLEGEAVTKKSVEKSIVSTLVPTFTSLFWIFTTAKAAPVSVPHSHESFDSFHFSISPFARALSALPIQLTKL